MIVVKGVLGTICILFAASGLMFSQTSASAPETVRSIKSSPAYAEILLRKTEILADIEAYSPDYTESSQKMLDLRTELASLDTSLAKIFTVRPTEVAKLTQGLGKLIVKKAALDVELHRLLRKYNKEHPEVLRAQRRVNRFEAAITELLK